MYVESVPNRNSPPAILLRETYRHDGKVKKRTLLNLSDWPRERVEGLRALLKGGVVMPPDTEPLQVIRTLPHGHVAAVLGVIGKIGLDRQGLRMKIAEIFDGMEFGVVRGVFLRSGDPHVGKDFGGRILGFGRPPLWRQNRAPAD